MVIYAKCPICLWVTTFKAEKVKCPCCKTMVPDKNQKLICPQCGFMKMVRISIDEFDRKWQEQLSYRLARSKPSDQT